VKKQIAILAVLSRTIVAPTIPGTAPYISNETEVRRFSPDFPIGQAMADMREEFPSALSFEIYEPDTCPHAVERI